MAGNQWPPQNPRTNRFPLCFQSSYPIREFMTASRLEIPEPTTTGHRKISAKTALLCASSQASLRNVQAAGLVVGQANTDDFGVWSFGLEGNSLKHQKDADMGLSGFAGASWQNTITYSHLALK